MWRIPVPHVPLALLSLWSLRPTTNRTGGLHGRHIHLFDVPLNHRFVIPVDLEGRGSRALSAWTIKRFSRYHMSYPVTLSCRPLRVLPLLAVLLHFKSHTLHEYTVNFVHGAYHASGLSKAPPSSLTLSITTIRRPG